jgi:hypothetical protein
MFEISFIIAIMLIGIVVTLRLMKGFLKGDPCRGCGISPKTLNKTKKPGKRPSGLIR